MKTIKKYIFVVLFGGLCLTHLLLAQEIAQNNGREDSQSLWKAKLIKTRLDKDNEYKYSPTSPMAAKQRLTVKTEIAKPLYISETNQVYAATPEKPNNALFYLLFQDNQWTWQPLSTGIRCMLANQAVAPGAVVSSQALFNGGACVLRVYFNDNEVILQVFDPTRPQQQHFSHLLYYPPDPQYAIPATLEKLPQSESTVLTTTRNLKKNYYRYARIHFKLAGKDLVLTAFKASLAENEDDHILFIPFGDQTNGTDTYDVGRFLEIDEPTTASFILDFNYCFNPLCNYADAYNCPIPPQENILDASINAGEKKYPH